MTDREDEIRREIFALVREYHALHWRARPFVPGVTPVPASGKVFDAAELESLIDAALEFWLTSGRFADRLEMDLAAWTGARHCLLVNSGSSANLLAISALTAADLGDRRLRPGDEVITTAVGFPTTLNPIVQNGLTPVFVDIGVPTYNVDAASLDAAVGPRTRAIVLAHTLGNPFDVDAVKACAERHGLWLVEDTCDALGTEYRGRKAGTFGDLATLSFYPAHHITTGEGGAVLTSNPLLRRVVESLRDWGRDCWCDPGHDNTCGKRFEWQLGELPPGYDHKYAFSRIGYNLKVTDLQAAVGVAQLAKLPEFVRRRRRNFAFLRERLADLADRVILPEATPGGDPSWFGFPITLREESPVSRLDLVRELESHAVATRLLFAGNLLRQPAYRDIPRRVAGPLDRSDLVMRQTFWVGIYPGLSEQHLEHTANCLHAALGARGVRG
jgi:CDP-4-dehydro-6-deoxyglucose reductase, E1